MAIILIMMLLPQVLYAQIFFDVDTVKYRIISEEKKEVELVSVKNITMTRYVDIQPKVVYNGDSYSVAAIGPEVFRNCEMYSVTIPNTVKKIGDSAFRNTMLYSVTIPESVTTLGINIFSNCHWLEDVQILAPLTSIPESTFTYTNLKTIALPNTVTSIGDGAFFWASLKSITLPASIEHIGSLAFYYSLREIVSLNPVAPSDVAPDAFPEWAYTTLRVPKGSLESYRNTYPWNLCRTIIEMDGETGISDADSDGATDAPVDIYNMQGARVRKDVSPGDTDGLPSGIYIIGGKKVFVK